MSINDPLFSLDILGASDDITASNCILRQNKTELLGRGPLGDIVSMRDDILNNRGYRVPEAWDHSWSKIKGPVWTPASITTGALETWICPEYFRPETDNPTLCIEATNRMDDSVAFEQTATILMPELVEGLKNFQGLKFDGEDVMKAVSNTMWNVGTGDFLMAMVIDTDGCNEREAVATKKNTDAFALDVNFSAWDQFGGNSDIVFACNGTDYTVEVDVGSGRPKALIVCGREEGYPTLYANGTLVVKGLTDTADLTITYKPWLGDRLSFSGEFKGTIYELVFINASMDDESSRLDSVLREKLSGYLAWKYGLTDLLHSGHAYKNEPLRESVV